MEHEWTEGEEAEDCTVEPCDRCGEPYENCRCED